MVVSSAISTPARAASSSRRYHSAELRARRETSRASTIPISPNSTADTSRANPSRSCAAALPAALLPWSSSMTVTCSAGQPSSRARSTNPYWRRALSGWRWTWEGCDCRT